MTREKLKSSNYFKFVFNKTERELYEKGSSIDPLKSMSLINHLKNSQNQLRDIYLVSRVKGFEPLAKYLLFMLKKAETEQVNFENLLQNMDADKDFLIKILTDTLKTKIPVSGRRKWEEVRKGIDLSSRSKTGQGEQKTEQKYPADTDSKFKIEELDNELVTEEFIDKDLSEINLGQKNKDEYGKQKHGYLELIKNEDKEEDKKAFSLPGEEPPEEEEKETVITETEQKEAIRKKTKTEFPGEENAAFDIDDLKPKKEKEEFKKNIKEKSDKEEKQKKAEVTEELPVDKASIEEKTKDGKKETRFKKIRILTDEQLPFTGKKETGANDNIETMVKKETVKKAEELQVNTAYLEYESELITRNALLLTDLDELAALFMPEGSEERKVYLINSIVDNSSFMEENSIKMSFEIITNIYGIIRLAFTSSLQNDFDITVAKIKVFQNSLRLIESLIKGVDFEGYDNVIKEAEKMKMEITERNKQKENLAKMEKDKLELEKHLSKKYSDTTQREKLILLKQYILEVENIFESIGGIRSEFQVYEALRKLSSSFVRFREMVNISRILHIKKLAQLSEASYIFVKFLQNYRLSPYDEEVKEIFDFIIYNLKLIFLDKPTKDLEAFISILNDPVQLFSKQKGKKKSE